MSNALWGNKPTSAAARHARQAYQRKFSFSQTVFIGTIAFLFLPLFVLILYSFNESKGMEWTRFSFVWYEKLFFDSKDLWRAFSNSAIVAISS